MGETYTVGSSRSRIDLEILVLRVLDLRLREVGFAAGSDSGGGSASAAPRFRGEGGRETERAWWC
jgi:hypothetical protein